MVFVLASCPKRETQRQEFEDVFKKSLEMFLQDHWRCFRKIIGDVFTKSLEMFSQNHWRCFHKIIGDVFTKSFGMFSKNHEWDVFKISFGFGLVFSTVPEPCPPLVAGFLHMPMGALLAWAFDPPLQKWHA